MDQTLQYQRKLWGQCWAIESPGGHSIVVNSCMSACHETFTTTGNAAFDFCLIINISSIVTMLVIVINIWLFFFFWLWTSCKCITWCSFQRKGRAEVYVQWYMDRFSYIKKALRTRISVEKEQTPWKVSSPVCTAKICSTFLLFSFLSNTCLWYDCRLSAHEVKVCCMKT